VRTQSGERPASSPSAGAGVKHGASGERLRLIAGNSATIGA
jgi:hypothetical protein